MSFVVRATRLATHDTPFAGSGNQVTGVHVEHLAMVFDDGKCLFYDHEISPDAEELTELEVAERRLHEILQLADQKPSGLISVRLEGRRRYLVPRHHWPTFQFAREL